MPHPRLAVPTIAAVTIALATCGCGGTSKSSTTTAQTAAKSPTTTTTAQTEPATQGGQATVVFVKQAEAICTHLNAEVAPLHQTNFAVIAPILASLEHRALAAMTKLTPPASIAEGWKQFIAYQRSIDEGTVKLGEYAKAKELNQVRTQFYTIDSLQTRMLATARRNKLLACTHST
jgi:hypothetical protein